MLKRYKVLLGYARIVAISFQNSLNYHNPKLWSQQNSKPFSLGEKQKESFVQLKMVLSATAAIAHLDYSLPYYIEIHPDASNYAVFQLVASIEFWRIKICTT